MSIIFDSSVAYDIIGFSWALKQIANLACLSTLIACAARFIG